MNKLLFSLLAVAALFAFASCSKSGPTDAEEDASIQAYITKKGWTASKTPEGVYYVTDVAGSGTATPALSNTVTVYYKGYLLSDETVFDKNLAPSTPSVFPLSGVIEGWGIGFQKFKVGSKGKLIIPSRYAYGSTARSSIPANSILVFEVELISFK